VTQAAIIDRLLEAWRSGRLDDADLPTAGLGLDDGLALQLELLDRLLARGERLGGWKVGLTSGTALDRMGPGFRPFGFILASRVFASGDRAPLAGGPDSVEGELCFRLGEPVAGDGVTPDDVRRAVCAPGGAVAAGLELNDRGRYTGDVAALSIAANMTNWGIVVGDAISPVPAGIDLDDLRVDLRQDGREAGSQHARGHIDDHFLSLSRLVRQLARFDRGLEAGQHVITGAFVRTRVTGPTRVEAEFSGIGRAVMRLDGFVSADAGYGGGELVTPAIRFEGTQLELNLDTGGGGAVKVEIQDRLGRPIVNYAETDASYLCGNSVRMPVRWGERTRLGDLSRQPIRIRFVMRDCKLYAFQFTSPG
jgi:2-keto-4-pentenoate hydratase